MKVCRFCFAPVRLEVHKALSGESAALWTTSEGKWVCHVTGNAHDTVEMPEEARRLSVIRDAALLLLHGCDADNGVDLAELAEALGVDPDDVEALS